MAPRPQLLAGKPFTPCDSQLSLGSVAGHTHRRLPVCQLNRFDVWEQNGENIVTQGRIFLFSADLSKCFKLIDEDAAGLQVPSFHVNILTEHFDLAS